MQSPGGWTPGVEEDGQMHAFILVGREMSVYGHFGEKVLVFSGAHE